MSGIDTNSLSIIQSALNYSNKLTANSSPLNTQNGVQKGAVYAEEGDPFYQKEMDKNEDGVVTYEEFKDYCLENDVSASEMKQMLQDRLNYQINNDTHRISAEIKEIKTDSDQVYAKEGDENYDEAIDEDGDGNITYEEYMKYCEENGLDEEEVEKLLTSAVVEKADDETFVIKNFAKAFNSYKLGNVNLPEAKIKEET